MKAKSKNSTARAKKEAPAAKKTSAAAKKTVAVKKRSSKEAKKLTSVPSTRRSITERFITAKAASKSGSFIENKSPVKKATVKRIPPEVAKIQNMSEEELNRYTEQQFRGKKRMSLAELFPEKAKK